MKSLSLFRTIGLALFDVLALAAATGAQAQGPRLTIERAPWFAASDVRVVVDSDLSVIVSGQVPPSGQPTGPAPWASRIFRKQVVGPWGAGIAAPPDSSGNASDEQWICRAAFGDGSLLVDATSPRGTRRIRVFSDGRIDPLSPVFPSGPVLDQDGASLYIGVGRGEVSVSPLTRFLVLLDPPVPGHTVGPDPTFPTTPAADWTATTYCVNLAAGAPVSGTMWAWLRDKSAGEDGPVRLALLNGKGRLVPTFQPLQRITNSVGTNAAQATFLCPMGAAGVIYYDRGLGGMQYLGVNGVRFVDDPVLKVFERIAEPMVALGMGAGSVLVSTWDTEGGIVRNGLHLQTRFGTADPTFRADLPVGFRIGGVLLLKTGKLLVVRHSGGEPMLGAPPVLRLNADGSLDGSFVVEPLIMSVGARISGTSLAAGKVHRLQVCAADRLGQWQDGLRFVLPEDARLPAEILRPSPVGEPDGAAFWRLVEE